jgi:hypothetical protein
MIVLGIVISSNVEYQDEVRVASMDARVRAGKVDWSVLDLSGTGIARCGIRVGGMKKVNFSSRVLF